MRSRFVFLLMMAAVAAFAHDYVVVQESTLDASAEVVTIQQPASGVFARTVKFVAAYVACSVDCIFQIERDGTAATTTATTITPVNSVAPPATATAFRSSNVGSGRVLGKYPLAAGGWKSVDLHAAGLWGSGSGKNLTVRIGSLTGTVRVVVQWSEE